MSSNVLSISSVAAIMRSGSVERIEIDRACVSLSVIFPCPASKHLKDSTRPGSKLFRSGIARANAAHSALASNLISFNVGRNIKKETVISTRNARSIVTKISMILKSFVVAVRPLPVLSRDRSPEDVRRFTELVILENPAGLAIASK